jgi:undecaprenyl-diphosphatase
VFTLIVIGTIPAAVVGFFLQKIIEKIFNSLALVGFSLLITAGLLFLSKGFTNFKKYFNQMNWLDSLIVGLFQALAILPGVSRSGSTIISGLMRGLSTETAFRFSFYLAIPAILGATILQIPDMLSSQFNYLNQAILGMFVAGVTGYLALVTLQKILRQGKLWFFGFYCLALGLFLLLF